MVLHGFSHYWTIRGLTLFEKKLTSNNAVKVLPETHPILAKKIEKLHNIIVDQEIRIRNDIQKTIPTIPVPTFQSPLQLLSSLQLPAEPAVTVDPPSSLLKPRTELKLPKMEIPRQFSKDRNKTNKSYDPAEASSLKSEVTNSFSATNIPSEYLGKETDHFVQAQSYKLIRNSNITHRQITTEELNKIHLPVFKDYDHRWYIIDFKDDFTYMYIPETDEFLSHHRLQKSAAQSNYKNKVVQLSMRKRSNFNCFVTPPSLSYLYMGPFSGDSKPPVVILLSLVNGKVVPRQKEALNPYGSVTTSFIISVGENGIDCPDARISSPLMNDGVANDDVRLVAPPSPAPIQPKVFKNLFDTSSKTTNIGHITIQKLSVQAGGVAKISMPQVEGQKFTTDSTPQTTPEPVRQQKPMPLIPPQLQQPHSNSFLRKCLSAAPKPITTPVKTTLNNLNSISGLKISHVKSLREEEAPTPKPIFKTYSRPSYAPTTPTKSHTSSEDTTEYGYYIADHETAPKVFAKKTEDSITLKTPAIDEVNGSRIVRVKMESAVIRYLNE